MDSLLSQSIPQEATHLPSMPVAQLAKQLQVGDLVFIRIKAKAYIAIADVTLTWTNHVGVVTHIDGGEPYIGESIFPVSRITPFSKFVARSEHGRVAVSRLHNELTPEQIELVQHAVRERTGVLYDIGFNFHHPTLQFCSRYAHEVLHEAAGVSVGQSETIRHMVRNTPNVKTGLWKCWFFGQIPWERMTITPVSLLESAELQPVFHGSAIVERRQKQNKLKRTFFKPTRVFCMIAVYCLRKCVTSLHKIA